jgi:hypothetical protein
MAECVKKRLKSNSCRAAEREAREDRTGRKQMEMQSKEKISVCLFAIAISENFAKTRGISQYWRAHAPGSNRRTFRLRYTFQRANVGAGCQVFLVSVADCLAGEEILRECRDRLSAPASAGIQRAVSAPVSRKTSQLGPGSRALQVEEVDRSLKGLLNLAKQQMEEEEASLKKVTKIFSLLHKK